MGGAGLLVDVPTGLGKTAMAVMGGMDGYGASEVPR
jgi:ERCC4-related helicase